MLINPIPLKLKSEGNFIDEFKWLGAYYNSLRIINQGSEFLVEISKDALEEEEEKRVFSRMYVCFFASKVFSLTYYLLCIIFLLSLKQLVSKNEFLLGTMLFRRAGGWVVDLS